MENKNKIEQLLNEVHTISESYERVAEATGENFNIFSIMRMESDEVKTHSRFIAELLNPKGKHGQMDIFLKLFVKHLNIDDFKTENAKIFVEYNIGQISDNTETGGRIDILIKSEGYVIMIENKIYAGEQPNQLLRYQNAFPKGKLLYLTLYGNESIQEPSKQVEYSTISYKDHIINWLENCKKESVNIPILRESISQYINLIKKLTHQNLNNNMNQDLIQKVLRDKNNFNSFRTLVNIKDEVFKYVLKEKLFNLLKDIVNEGNGKIQLELNEEYLLSSSNNWKRFLFTNDKSKAINLGICFSFNVTKGYQNFIYGFHFIHKQPNQEIYEILKSEFNNIFAQYKSSEWWPCWKDYDEYINWEDSDTLQRIIFETDFKEDFKQKVKLMFDIIEKVYPEINLAKA